jgi:hypothetical protein
LYINSIKQKGIGLLNPPIVHKKEKNKKLEKFQPKKHKKETRAKLPFFSVSSLFFGYA